MKWEIAGAIILAFNGCILLGYAWHNRKVQGEEAIVTGCIVVGTVLIGLAGGLLA